MTKHNFLFVFTFCILVWALIFLVFRISLGYSDEIDCTRTDVICLEDQLTEEQKASSLAEYKRRGQAYKLDVANEIERQHELEIETRKIEVLGRLNMLKSNNISVSSSSFSNTQTIANTGTFKQVNNHE